MDMKRFLKTSLTVPELEAIGGEYESVIASVAEEEIRNRFTGKRSMEPVVSFPDGRRLILNKTMLRACIKWFGTNSDDWIGRSIRLFLRRVETINQETGETKVRVQRGILCEDPHARAPSDRRRPTRAADDALCEAEFEKGSALLTTANTGAMVTAEEIFTERPGR